MSNPADKEVLSPATTRARLEQWQHRPNRRLGQNFLVDGNIVRKSIALAELSQDDPVIEVGPGLGTLTAVLLEAGARPHCIELDPHLFQNLTRLFEPEIASGRLQLMEGDCVDHPTAGCAADPRNKVVANLPYAVTSPWLEALLQQPTLPSRMVLMLQQEAADRLTAPCGSKNYGAVTILLQAAYTCRGRHHVPRQCFQPVPDVDSMLIRFDRSTTPHRLSPQAYARIRAMFTRRRKQIGGIVRSLQDPILEKWLEVIAVRHGIAPETRPEAVPVNAWLELDSCD